MRLSIVALLTIAAWTIEYDAGQARQGDLFALTPLSFDGFNGAETSTTLPGAAGQPRAYRWSKPTSSITLWPLAAPHTALNLTYLSQFGTTLLQVEQHAPIALPPAAQLRHLHLLLPQSRAATITLTRTPTANDAHPQLGMIVIDPELAALGNVSSGSLWSYRKLLFGLPLTLLLLGVVGFALRLRRHWLVVALAATLAGMAVLATQSPWDARALQPTLQTLLGAALLGAALWALGRRVARVRWATLLVSVWAVSLLLFFSPGVESDGVGYYAYVRSVFIDGDLNFSDEFNPQQSPFMHTPRNTPAPRPGYLVNSWSVGPALFWTPFWLIGHAITLAGKLLGLFWHADGYAMPYVVMIAFGSALAGLATMLGCFRLLTRWFLPSVAALATTTLYLGSNLLFYAQFEGSFAHSLSAATATWFVLATLQLDDAPTTLRRWLVLGLATGAMLVTYWITALLLLIPLAVLLRHAWRRAQQCDEVSLRRMLGGALVAGGAAVLVFVPQLIAWKLVLGSWLAIPQGAGFVTPGQTHLLDMLVGPLYGLAWWTPAFFVGLLGSAWFAWRRPWPGAVLLAAIGLYLAYNASLPDWHGSGAFGLRRLASLAPLFVIGLAALFDASRRVRPLPAMLASVLITWSLGMLLRYVTYQLPHAPFRIRGLGLHAMLLSPTPVPIDALRYVAQESWFGTLARTADSGSLLILGVCLGAAVVLALLRRMFTRRCAAVQHAAAAR